MNLPNKNKIKKIAKEFDIKLILLFGSQVNGKIHKESDIDLAFLSEKELSFEQENLLNVRFCNLFGKDTGVDTVNLKTAPPLLLKEILDCHKIIYQENPLDFATLEAAILQKYREARPLFEMGHERIKQFIKSL